MLNHQGQITPMDEMTALRAQVFAHNIMLAELLTAMRVMPGGIKVTQLAADQAIARLSKLPANTEQEIANAAALTMLASVPHKPF